MAINYGHNKNIAESEYRNKGSKAMAEDITKRTVEEVRVAYRRYLKAQNLSMSTITVSLSDAFYIWRKKDAESFWKVILSDRFEALGKETLIELLHQHSKGNDEINMNHYMAHLRRFRRFLKSDFRDDIPEVGTPPSNSRKRISVKIERILPVPSVEQVEYYLAKWAGMEDYRLQEDALNRLFFELSPENNNLSDILLKVSVLNDFYSTNIFKVFPVAKHIQSLHIDSRLRDGDVTLVNDIKRVDISGKTKNFYSFATKYCSHHNPIDYPIYDSYVDEVLRYFRNHAGFSGFQNGDLKDYIKFKGILVEFCTCYGLCEYNLKQIDQYLWQLGKDYFPKSFVKK